MDPVAMTRDTYELIAGEYAKRNRDHFPGLLAAATEFANAVPAGPVADIGCGTGRDLQLLRKCGLSAIGLDLSRAMLTAGGLTGVAQADMRALPLRTDSLAGVWCQAALLHIPHTQVPAVLAEMSRVCVRGGRLYLAVAEGDGETVEPPPSGGGLLRFFAYHRIDPMRELLAGAGFEVTAVRREAAHRQWLHINAIQAG
jgi:SAM-dependent methyltransferase